MKNLLLTGMAWLGMLALHAQQPLELPLYPDGPAESAGFESGEYWVDSGRVADVQTPMLYVYLPERAAATGRAVVICPGGGYARLAIEKEGHAVARWMTGQGIAAVVLKYRMPNGHYDIPLKDAQTALETVRRRAAEWNVEPEKVGIMGFSAGGHLASTAATHFTSEANRPAFAVLVYPVITMGGATHGGSRERLIGKDAGADLVEFFSNEKQVTAETPTSFIALSDDDRGVPPANGVSYYLALREHGVPGELHVYPTGGHGWGGFDTRFRYEKEFQTSLARWLKDLE